MNRTGLLQLSRNLSRPISATRPTALKSKSLFHGTTPTMSTQQPKNEYLVSIPDIPNSLSKRLAARPAHLAALKPHIESGKVVFGGATLSDHPTGDEGPDMTGSVMLIKANSEEEVREWVRGDEYVKQGAWDVRKMTIVPFKCAVRTAL